MPISLFCLYFGLPCLFDFRQQIVTFTCVAFAAAKSADMWRAVHPDGVGVAVFGRSSFDSGLGFSQMAFADAETVERIHFVAADLDGGLPALEGCFDYILCADVLEHLREPGGPEPR